MESQAKIIVLDDEAELRNMLQRFLSSHGFEVRVVADSKRLDRYLQREPFDLLILDLMMDQEDGLSVCRRLRAEGQTLPILILTAKGDPVDKVIGLETGADDYLAKPFLPSELVARVRALLRRQKIAAGEPVLRSQTVRFGDYCLDRYLEIDPARQELSLETGRAVHNVVRVRSQAGAAGTIFFASECSSGTT